MADFTSTPFMKQFLKDAAALAETDARRGVIRHIIKDLISQQITMEEAVISIDHLTMAAAINRVEE